MPAFEAIEVDDKDTSFQPQTEGPTLKSNDPKIADMLMILSSRQINEKPL